MFPMHAVGLAAQQGRPILAYEIAGSVLDPGAQVTSNILTVKLLLAPLSKQDIKIVRCLGLNYSDHAVCNFLCCPNTTSHFRLGRG